MTISERIFDIMQEKGIRPVDLAAKIEISKSLVSTWKKRNTDPPASSLVKICELLDISLECLLTGMDSAMGEAPGLELRRSERDLILNFRQLNVRDQDEVIDSVGRKLSRTFTNAPKAESSTLHSGGGNTEKSEEDGAIA